MNDNRRDSGAYCPPPFRSILPPVPTSNKPVDSFRRIELQQLRQSELAKVGVVLGLGFADGGVDLYELAMSSFKINFFFG